MKTKIAIYAFLLLLGVVTGCKKNPVDPTPDPDPVVPVSTVEENKAVIENSAVELIDISKDIESITAQNYIKSFSYYLEIKEPTFPGYNDKSAVKNNSNVKLLFNLKKLVDKKMSIVEFFSSLKGYSEKSIKEDPTSIQEVMDDVRGTYEWNQTKQDWDFTTMLENKIIFKFPSSEGGLSNNAVLTFTYTGTTINLPEEIASEYSGDVPSKTTLSLVVDGTTYITNSLEIKYNTDGYPNYVNAKLTVENFSFETTTSYSETKVSTDYSFKQGSKIILAFDAEVTGDFKVSTYESMVSETEVQEVYCYETYDEYGNFVTICDTSVYTDTEMDLEIAKDVVHNVHTSIQVLNIKLDGTLNAKTLANTLYNLNQNGEISEEQGIEALNDNVILKVINVETTEVISKSELYLKNVEYQVDNGYYDENWNWVSVMETETRVEIALRFVFHDGSKIDAETYFNEGFGSFISELNKYFEELNSEYDLDFEPIEYPITK
jgi:hypothetical protein